MSIQRVVETCLYVEDVERAARWYEDILGLSRVTQDPPRHVFLQAGDSMLLLFDAEHTKVRKPGDKSAVHGAQGVQHVALGVEDLAPWRERLAGHGVTIVEEATWGEGRSIYFHDPSGNLVELVTPGTWPVW
ncbi:MAG: VOC family protein [Candidatus Thermoplasmatota archaeon]|nr:VOC family protein [Candidatus Thermoplasmatota archaeon]